MIEITHAAGQDDFSSTRDNILRRGEGFLLVFAVNSRNSFQEIVNFQQHILQIKDADRFPMLLVGNKSDIDSSRRQVTSEGTFTLPTLDIETMYRIQGVGEVAWLHLRGNLGQEPAQCGRSVSWPCAGHQNA